MMAISNFLVYTYTDRQHTQKQFLALGFNQVSVNKLNEISIWHNHNCIVMLKKGTTNGISGIGFLTSPDIINKTRAKYDPESGWFKFGEGLEVYLQSEDRIPTIIKNEYQTISKNIGIKTGVDKFSGIVINSSMVIDKVNLEELNLKVMASDRYLKYITQNNFSLYLDIDNQTDVPTVFVDCHDIFKTISLISLDSTVKFKKYDKQSGNFGLLTHKINGYNCMAEGNKDSYSIEKMIIGNPDTVNIVLRQRSKKISISEETLQVHLNEQDA
ncbi:hypothetical protein N9N08_00215 [bacterium]|jgi:hypothetical protein|nr:hypothetical protein [bacterium]